MESTQKQVINITTDVQVPLQAAWDFWNIPNHIMHWYAASEDWQTTRVVNDLVSGGKFVFHMEAKDGSAGFDFNGEYTLIEPLKKIEYTIEDGRKVKITFIEKNGLIKITESFEAENIHAPEIQQAGWQSILNNFKHFAESTGNREVLHYEILIGCTPEKLWKVMFDPDGYREWTSVFNPTSHYKGSWTKNSGILFLGTDNKGKTAGIVSRIKENMPARFMSIEHLGIVKDGEKIMEGPEADLWKGFLENYHFTGFNGKTLLKVDLDSMPGFRDYFNETWPNALKRLKIQCEKS